ncbi:hypothetical protein HK096_003807, partial [Nowakowskiella sp. JEL0078]
MIYNNILLSCASDSDIILKDIDHILTGIESIVECLMHTTNTPDIAKQHLVSYILFLSPENLVSINQIAKLRLFSLIFRHAEPNQNNQHSVWSTDLLSNLFILMDSLSNEVHSLDIFRSGSSRLDNYVSSLFDEIIVSISIFFNVTASQIWHQELERAILRVIVTCPSTLSTMLATDVYCYNCSQVPLEILVQKLLLLKKLKNLTSFSEISQISVSRLIQAILKILENKEIAYESVFDFLTEEEIYNDEILEDYFEQQSREKQSDPELVLQAFHSLKVPLECVISNFDLTANLSEKSVSFIYQCTTQNEEGLDVSIFANLMLTLITNSPAAISAALTMQTPSVVEMTNETVASLYRVLIAMWPCFSDNQLDQIFVTSIDWVRDQPSHFPFIE